MQEIPLQAEVECVDGDIGDTAGLETCATAHAPASWRLDFPPMHSILIEQSTVPRRHSCGVHRGISATRPGAGCARGRCWR